MPRVWGYILILTIFFMVMAFFTATYYKDKQYMNHNRQEKENIVARCSMSSNIILCLKRLALDGNVMAQKYLGLVYYRGLGTHKDYVESYKWYKLAEKNGAAMADKAVELILKNHYKEIVEEVGEINNN